MNAPRTNRRTHAREGDGRPPVVVVRTAFDLDLDRTDDRSTADARRPRDDRAFIGDKHRWRIGNSLDDVDDAS